MKKSKVVFLISTLSLLLTAQFVSAQGVRGDSQADSQRAMAKQAMQDREAIMKNREHAISDMVSRLLPPDAVSIDRYQFEQMLRKADTNTLLAVSQVWEFDDARAILLKSYGNDEKAASTFAASRAVGDVGRDYVYSAVAPCRIVDTRPSSGGVGTLGSNTTMNVFVWGDGLTIGGQGGNTAGCPAPRGEPRAVHVNATVVPTGTGFLTVYPAGTAQPLASLVNYQPDNAPIANAAIIQTNFDLVGPELSVFTSRTTHVIIDVLGYFYEADAIDPAILPTANVSGSVMACARETTTGNIVLSNTFQNMTSFCFRSEGLTDNHNVSHSFLWQGIPAGTYTFGMCGWQGDAGACAPLMTAPQEPWTAHGAKITAVHNDVSLGDATIFHSGYDLVTADPFAVNGINVGNAADATFLSDGVGNTTITIGTGDSVWIQGSMQVFKCDEDEMQSYYGFSCLPPAGP